MDAKQRLIDIANGYQHSVVLLAACNLGVFAALGEGAATAAELAGRLGLDARGLETVLLALTADGWLTVEGEAFRVAEEYAPSLLPDSPATQANILAHGFSCLQSWARIDEVLRTGRPVATPASADAGKDMRNFIRGMSDVSRASSAEVADKFDLSPFRRMLDVGGGPGTSSIVFAQRNPGLECVVLDLEGPLGVAREEIAKAGLSDRVTTRAGDYFQDGLGEGFDLVYISNIIHSLGPEDVDMLIGKARAALEPGGAIAVKEFFLDDSRTRPDFAALFSVNMLVRTEKGRSYAWRQVQEILERHGFGEFERIEVAAASGVLIGRRPEA